MRTLEGRCEELEALLEQRVREAEQRGRRQERQGRAHSVPSLCPPPGGPQGAREPDFRNRYDALGYPSVFGDDRVRYQMSGVTLFNVGYSGILVLNYEDATNESLCAMSVCRYCTTTLLHTVYVSTKITK